MKSLKKHDINDARHLVQRLYELTSEEFPEADWYADRLDEFIASCEKELFPEEYSRKMDKLRNRMSRIRGMVNAATEEEGGTA